MATMFRFGAVRGTQRAGGRRYDRAMSSLQGMGAMESLQPSPTIVEQVYRTILDAICDGRLEPGERLTQESVAQKLSVSRQPVGQALLLLKQQKFVSEAGRRGLMVAPLDRDFMRSIYELRLGIEPLAATLAARHATSRRYRTRGANDCSGQGSRSA